MLALLGGWHVAASLWTMAALPSLASGAWYERGGVRRLVQVLATDVAGPKTIAALGAAALVAYAWGAPSRGFAAFGRGRSGRPGGVDEQGRRTAAGSGAAARVGGRGARRGRTGLRVALSAGLVALALIGLGRPRASRHPGERPDLVLVGLPSLDAAGFGPDSTPALAALARQGVAFDQALVSSTDASLERAVWASGVEPPRWRSAGPPVDDALLERLARAGYRVAVVGDDELAGRLGRAAPEPAFERWPLALEPLRSIAKAVAVRLGRAPPTRRDLRDADEAVGQALRFVDAGDGPFALALFLPEARPPFAGACARALAFADPAYRGGCKYRGCQLGPAEGPPDEGEVRQALALRAGALACDDDALGRLLERLRERGLERTAVVAAFGEGGATAARAAGRRGGGPPLDDRTLRAPLVIRAPGLAAPATRGEPVRDLDLAPTLAALLGLEGGLDLPGRSLVAALRGGPLADVAAFAEADVEAPAGASTLGRRWALSAGPHRLVARSTREGLALELFDRRDDPEQARDLSAEMPALRDALRDELLGLVLRERALTLRFGHVVPRPPAETPAPPTAPPEGARHERQTSLLDAPWVPPAPLEARPPGGATSTELSTLAADPWAPPTAHPARRRVTLVTPGGRAETRRALVAPGRAALLLPWRPGPRSRLRVAPAPLATPERPLPVEVRVRRRGAPPEIVGAWTLGADEAGRWVEREIDLGRFAGLDVELELGAPAGTPDGDPAIAWGSPALVEPYHPELPYNVVLVAVAGRDAGRRASEPAPSPGDDAFAAGGVSFPDFAPAATRPGAELLALLAGMRSGELGLDVGGGPPSQATLDALYARRPPLLAPLFRRAGATTLVLREGAPSDAGGAELDLGFDASIELGASRAAGDALASWLEAHRRDRFFVLARLEGSSAPGPREAPERAALGALLAPLRRLSLERETVVVVTDVPGEAAGAYDEPGRFLRWPRRPLVVLGPGLAPGARPEIAAHATDVAPTLLALEGLAIDARMRGRALLGAAAADAAGAFAPRARVTEGKGARSLRSGPLVFVERDARSGPGGEARSFLFDAQERGGQARDRSAERPEEAERLRDQLAREVARHRSAEAGRSEALAGSRFAPPPPSPRARVGLRFYGGAERHRVTLRVEKPGQGPGEVAPSLRLTPVGLDPDALYDGPSFVDAAFMTRPDRAVGFDLELAPSTAPLTWNVAWDDRPLEGRAWLAGPQGLSLPALREGLRDEGTRRFAEALTPPADLSPSRDEGVLVFWHELSDPP